MKPINIGGHAAYQAKLISLLKQYYPDAFIRFGPSLWDTIGKFFSMDLTKIDVLMYNRYSVFGPKPRLPSDMIRSIMLSLVMKKTSFTSWSEELKTNPIAAIISGFHPDDTPGVGTFYDFCDRLWMSDKDNLSDHAQPPKKRKVESPKIRMIKHLPLRILQLKILFLSLKRTHFLMNSPTLSCFRFFMRYSLNAPPDSVLSILMTWSSQVMVQKSLPLHGTDTGRSANVPTKIVPATVGIPNPIRTAVMILQGISFTMVMTSI